MYCTKCERLGKSYIQIGYQPVYGRLVRAATRERGFATAGARPADRCADARMIYYTCKLMLEAPIYRM
jgi:hypothetical protein